MSALFSKVVNLCDREHYNRIEPVSSNYEGKIVLCIIKECVELFRTICIPLRNLRHAPIWLFLPNPRMNN